MTGSQLVAGFAVGQEESGFLEKEPRYPGAPGRGRRLHSLSCESRCSQCRWHTALSYGGADVLRVRSIPVGGQCALGHPGPDLCAGKLSEFVKARETCWAPAFIWTPFCIAGVLSLPGRARPAFRPELSLRKARDQGVGHTASLGGDLTASGGRRERRRPYRSSPGTAEKMQGATPAVSSLLGPWGRRRCVLG